MILKENRNYPYEGFFWIINNQVVGLVSEVPQYNYEFELDGKTHQNTWNMFKKEYLVGGKEVEFDYFPRGRVLIDPEYDLDNKFEEYHCQVFLDACIDVWKYKRMIIQYYNLDVSYIKHINWLNLSKRAGIDHYTCHTCRK